MWTNAVRSVDSLWTKPRPDVYPTIINNLFAHISTDLSGQDLYQKAVVLPQDRFSVLQFFYFSARVQHRGMVSPAKGLADLG